MRFVQTSYSRVSQPVAGWTYDLPGEGLEVAEYLRMSQDPFLQMQSFLQPSLSEADRGGECRLRPVHRENMLVKGHGCTVAADCAR